MKKVLGYLLTVSVLTLLVFGIGHPKESNTASITEGYKLDQKVPSFTLKGIDGKKYTLGDYQNKNIVVIDFWSATCPVSKAYEEYFKKLSSDYVGKGVILLALAPNKTESPGQIASVAKDRNVNFPVLIDQSHMIADKFQASTTPELFILDKNGVVRYHGGPDNRKQNSDPNYVDYTRLALDALLNGKEISVNQTKSFGCTIKR